MAGIPAGGGTKLFAALLDVSPGHLFMLDSSRLLVLACAGKLPAGIGMRDDSGPSNRSDWLDHGLCYYKFI
jgi:hypothetical protein